MRIRSIRPEFWASEDVAAMDWPTRLIFIGLWSYVDDNEVGRDLEQLIAAALFPLDSRDPRETLASVSGALAHLSEGGQISRYTVAGKAYLHVSNWSKHQKIDKPAKSRYPLPGESDKPVTSEDATPSRNPRESLARPSRNPLDISAPGEGEKGRRGEERETASAAGAASSPASDEGPEPTKPGRRKPAQSLPEDFAVDERMYAWAAEKGISAKAVIDSETEKFRDHHTAKGSRFADWRAAWQNWMRNHLDYEAKRAATAASRPNAELLKVEGYEPGRRVQLSQAFGPPRARDYAKRPYSTAFDGG